MTNLLQVTLLCLCMVSLAHCCGSRRRKCTYTTCSSSWGSWSPYPSQGQCTSQRSRASHRYTSHSRNGGCPGSSRCNTVDRWRHLCSCREVYHCSWGTWGSWQHGIARGTCGTQRRYRQNHQSVRYTNRVGSCNGVSTNCDRGNQDSQSRTMCNCAKVTRCDATPWSSWSPGVPTGQCRDQTRHQDYNPTHTYVQKLNNCNGIIPNCRSRLNDRRKYCSCRYLICTKNNWSPWKTIADSASCPNEERFQVYTGAARYKGAAVNCNSVYPTSCPGSAREERKKEIKCPKINPITKTTFADAACNGDKSSCNAVCQIRCNAKGYNVANARFVKCLGTGKWSGQIGYCNDTELPNVICPDPKPQGNDPNKNYASVDLPAAKATDNSGETPKVAVSHKSPLKVKVGDIVKVRYTATDGNGNSRFCVSLFESKDVEPPKVTFCPKEVMVQVVKFPHTVIWQEPTFTDNVDKYVSRTSTHRNGQLFPRGKHMVKYIANDKAFNTVTCEFPVQVTPMRCEAYPPPKHGAVSCNVKKHGYKELYICSPSCKQGHWFIVNKDSPVSYDFYVCAEDGTWRGVNEYNMSATHQSGLFDNVIPRGKAPWANCAEGSMPDGVSKEFKIIAGSCKDQKAMDDLKKKLIAKMKSDILIFHLYCNAAKSNCEVENIQITCASRMKRGTVVNEMEINLVLKVEDPSPSANEAERLKKLKEIKKRLGSITAELTKAVSSTVQTSQVNVQDVGDKFACKSGKAFTIVSGKGTADERSKCVTCPVGMYLNKAKGECLVCPVGTYQDDDGKESCIPCPKGTSTHGYHATNFTQCKEICEPGTYSATGLATCLACPKGTYQPEKNSTECMSCPAGFGTDKEGSSMQSDCTENAVQVFIQSEGCDDPGAAGCGQASIKVNNKEYSTKKRGYNVVVVDAKTGHVDSAHGFDTHCCADQTNNLISFISNLPNGKIVLVAAQDEATLHQGKNIFKAFSLIGGKEPFQREYRASFALAGYKGTEKVGWITQHSKPRRRGPSSMGINIPLKP